MSNGLTKAEKEVLRERLKSEKAVLKALEKQYETALEEIDDKIASLLGRGDADLPHVIHQVQYQRLIKAQVNAALDRLHAGEYETIDKYLRDSYTDGFVGTMYNLHRQDVPVIVPIEQEAAIKAVTIDSKLKEPLYESLGVDVTKLKKTISAEITRGIAAGYSYGEMAQGIALMTKAPLSRARTIVRTEAGRVQEQANFDAANKAKAAGADVVKQWSAVLDGKTRDTHRKLDHQIREMDKPFEIEGKKAMYPHDFGDPAEDCNCRCTLLTRARAALDEDELNVMRERASYHGLLVKDSKAFGHTKAKDFADFKEKYLKATGILKKQGKSGIIELSKDPYYEGLSMDDIAKRYKKADGSNLLDKSFFILPIETQRETVRGYDKAISMYGDIPPQRVKTEKMAAKKFATYDLDFKVITFNPDKVVEHGEAYATTVHEMTHHAENLKLFDSKKVVNSAFRKLAMSSTSKKADNLRMRTTGLDANWKDSREVVAYAVERQMTGRQNPLTEAIYSVLKERGIIK